MESSEIPVIIAHFTGKPNYLKFALKSAADFNKTVVLIGTKSNRGFWDNHWDTTSIECEKYQSFQKCYVKMSTYDENYDSVCWKRLFMLEEWMKRNNAKQAFYLDSDIMTFVNYSSVLPLVSANNYIAILSEQESQRSFGWSTCAHVTYWTLEAIEDFTSFCIEAYSNNESLREKLDAKWKWHIDNQKSGGVCDMNLLYFWSKDKPQIGNFAKVIDDMSVDYNINMSTNYLENEYEMLLGVKKITFKNDIPYCFNNYLNKQVRFLAIHFQSGAKSLMAFFYYKRLRFFYLFVQSLRSIKVKIKSLMVIR